MTEFPSLTSFPQYRLTNAVRDIVSHLALLVRLERKLLGIIASYAVAIGMLMLCVPIAVQVSPMTRRSRRTSNGASRSIPAAQFESPWGLL
jgi:hypothetical protein